MLAAQEALDKAAALLGEAEYERYQEGEQAAATPAAQAALHQARKEGGPVHQGTAAARLFASAMECLLAFTALG